MDVTAANPRGPGTLAWNTSNPNILLKDDSSSSDSDPADALPQQPQDVSFVAETLLPTDKGHFRCLAYKETSGERREIMVLVHGQVAHVQDVPVRVHDQCFTSEVLG